MDTSPERTSGAVTAKRAKHASTIHREDRAAHGTELKYCAREQILLIANRLSSKHRIGIVRED